MYVGLDFSVVSPDEQIDYSFDFSNDLGTNEFLESVVWSISVASGTDPTPNSHLIGFPALSPQSDNATITTQRIGGLLDSTKYRLIATATSNIGQVLELYSHVVCRSPD